MTARTRLLVPLLCALVVAACGKPAIVYRPDVQQGNVITQDMLDQLEPGMDKRKVRFVLGTPLIQDSFNPDRWDYYYSYQDRRKERSARRVTLWFEQDRLAKIDGHVLRAEAPRQPAPKPEQVVVVPERQDPGILAAFVPPFLKRDKREDALERSSPEEAEAAARERAQSEQVAAAQPAEAAAPPAPADGGVSEAQVREESEYFQRLFEGYGREPSEVESLITEPAPTTEDEPAAGPAPGAPEDAPSEQREPTAEEVAAGEADAPEASEEEKGFFSRMVDRMRRERSGEAEVEEEQSAPEPREEPGEED